VGARFWVRRSGGGQPYSHFADNRSHRVGAAVGQRTKRRIERNHLSGRDRVCDHNRFLSSLARMSFFRRLILVFSFFAAMT